MTIYLVRHADRFPNPPDPGLTELGFAQAKKTGQYLSQFNLEQIISSPLKRAKQTAEVINEVLNLPLSFDKRLKERINFGDIPQQNFADFLELWLKSTAQRNFKLPTGDSSISTGKEVENLINSFSGDNEILLVSHSGTIADFLRNLFPDQVLSQLKTKYSGGEEFELKNCSITQVEISSPPKLKLLNYVEHLN